jgi:single-stranded DNA-binding protein
MAHNTYNNLTIAGRLGKDSQALTAKSGTEYVRLSVATEPGLGEGTLWVDVVIYGGLGEAVRKLELRAGDLILVAGAAEPAPCVSGQGHDPDGGRRTAAAGPQAGA